MKKIFTLTLISAALLFSDCGHKVKSADRGIPKGQVAFGGILKVNESETIKSLLPIAINELNSYHVASQVYEGLVKYQPLDLSIQPALAESWEISADNTEYTFHLRNDVFFHSDSCFSGNEGRMVTTADVKFCFEQLCLRNPLNRQYDVTFKDRVVGANDLYAASAKGLAGSLNGLTIVDDATFKIKLLQPDANFLTILAMPGCYIYPKEAIEMYGKRKQFKGVGTGPFYIESMKDGQSIVMKRNTDYWNKDKDGNQLPYLDGVTWSFIKNKGAEISEFGAGNLDMVYNIKTSMLGGVLSQSSGKLNFELFSSPALTTEYYCFNVQVNPFFSIKEIRRAFNLAIDRQKIIEIALRGDGRIADHGLVPYTETFEKNGYNYKILKAYPYSPDSAKKLLALVGYAEGKGLPDFNLEINDGGSDRNLRVATEVQRMIKENIGVKINISIQPWQQHIENVQTGKSDFFRYAWVSDYPDPESFLTLFYGKHVPENYQDRSYINLGHFKNAQYDSLYVRARAESNQAARYTLFSQAERILLDESALMPLFYDENVRLVKEGIKNMQENPLNYMDFSIAYFSASQTALEKK
jgi:oligopeptide transport system substrate-binding protein